MWIETFLDYLKYERNYSARTVGEYGDDLNAFEAYFKKVDATLSWENIDGDIVRDWMVSMMEAGRAATTVNRRLSAVRALYRYALKREWVKADPARGIRGPKKKKPLPAFVKENEMDRLLDGDFFGGDFAGKRDRLIVGMFYATGIRLSELTGLDNRDVDLQGRAIKVTGKRNKQRVVPFGDELETQIREYLDLKSSLGLVDGGAMFVDQKGQRLKNVKVRALVRHYLGMVTTQRKRSPHVLRHTFATSMLNHHADLEALKELMGHESVSTTEVYTHTTFEELKEMYNLAHPRA